MNKRLTLNMLAIGALCCFVPGTSSATTVTSGTISASNGTTFTVAFTAFATNSASMAGMTVTIGWADSTTSSCTWASGCSVNNFFAISLANGSNGSYDGTWTLTDSRSTSNITSMTLDGVPLGSPKVAFDLNWTCAGAGTFAACADPTNGGNGNEGTVGSNIGYTFGTATGGATSPTPTTVVYSNLLKTGAAAPVGDEYGKVTVTWGAGFNNTDTFTWRMDTDNIVSATPEPATLTMVGMALLGLGALKVRGKRS